MNNVVDNVDQVNVVVSSRDIIHVVGNLLSRFPDWTADVKCVNSCGKNVGTIDVAIEAFLNGGKLQIVVGSLGTFELTRPGLVKGIDLWLREMHPERFKGVANVIASNAEYTSYEEVEEIVQMATLGELL